MKKSVNSRIFLFLSIFTVCVLFGPTGALCMKRKRTDELPEAPKAKRRKKLESVYLEEICSQIKKMEERYQLTLGVTCDDDIITSVEQASLFCEEDDERYELIESLMLDVLFYFAEEKKSIDKTIKIVKIIKGYFSKFEGSNYCSGPLHWVARCGNIQIAEFLISKVGLNVSELDSNGMTPLFYACFHHKLDMAKLLVQKGAKVDINIGEGLKATPLHCALYNCPNDNNIGAYVELIKFLIASGADATQEDPNGSTALFNLIDYNNEIFEKVIKKLPRKLLCDILIFEYDDKTRRINLKKKVKNIASLVYVINELEKAENDKFYPLHRVCGYILNFQDSKVLNDIMYLLFRAGVDINVENQDGKTPLDILVCLDNRRVLQNVAFMVVELGAKISRQTIRLASFMHKPFIITEKLLREFNKLNNIEQTSRLIRDIAVCTQVTPLHILISHVKHVNLLRVKKQSLFQRHEHTRMIEYFVKNGANIHKKIGDISPLDLAGKYDEVFKTTFKGFLLSKKLEKMLDDMQNGELQEDEGNGFEDNTDSCPICLESLQQKAGVRLSPCNHLCCLECAKRHLVVQDKCPQCREVVKKLYEK